MSAHSDGVTEAKILAIIKLLTGHIAFKTPLTAIAKLVSIVADMSHVLINAGMVEGLANILASKICGGDGGESGCYSELKALLTRLLESKNINEVEKLAEKAIHLAVEA